MHNSVNLHVCPVQFLAFHWLTEIQSRSLWPAQVQVRCSTTYRLWEKVLTDRRCMASCHHDFIIILMLFSLYWHSTFPVKSFRILVQLELWCPCSVYVQLEFPVKSFQQNMLLDWGTNWYHYFTYQVLLFSTTEQAQHVFGSGLVNSILWDKRDRSYGQQHAFIVFGKNINLIFSLRGHNENEYARPGS